MRNKKGFTLIEIMIVVAIIGILALVLVPRIGGMKESAKLAGLDTNLRMAEGTIQQIINDYSDPAQLETALINRLAAGGANAIKNPLTEALGVARGADFAAARVGAGATDPLLAGGNAAFVVLSGDVTNAAASAPTLTTQTDLKGVIYVQAYTSGSTLKVQLMPFDQDGLQMGGEKTKTITK